MVEFVHPASHDLFKILGLLSYARMSHSTGKNDGVRLMNAEEAYAAMAEKLQCRYNSVRKSFAAIKGQASDAQLSRSEFRQFLRHTGIELTGEEFGKLWKKFDTTGDGRLSYAEVSTIPESTMITTCLDAKLCSERLHALHCCRSRHTSAPSFPLLAKAS